MRQLKSKILVAFALIGASALIPTVVLATGGPKVW